MKAALALLVRDVVLAWREGGAIGTALGFYLVVVAITPFGLGPDLNLLARIAPGMLWVALLLASLLSADRIFHNDYEDGAQRGQRPLLSSTPPEHALYGEDLGAGQGVHPGVVARRRHDGAD